MQGDEEVQQQAAAEGGGDSATRKRPRGASGGAAAGSCPPGRKKARQSAGPAQSLMFGFSNRSAMAAGLLGKVEARTCDNFCRNGRSNFVSGKVVQVQGVNKVSERCLAGW